MTYYYKLEDLQNAPYFKNKMSEDWNAIKVDKMTY